MRIFIVGTVLLMTLGLCACGDRDRETKPVQETVFGDMVENKQRAKDGVDQAMEANKQKLDETMKKQAAAE